MELMGRRKDDIEEFLELPDPTSRYSNFLYLRYMIFAEGLGIPEGYDHCPYRPYVWSVLCEVPLYPTKQYLKLVSTIKDKLSPELYQKIRNDTFRTLKNDQMFHLKVSEDALIRILAAIAITIPNKARYVQGMNVLLAPIAYTYYRSEPQAFAVLHHLVTKQIPLYITPNLDGVHTALSLVDLVLRIIDPELSQFLDSKLLKAEIYAFPSILTLCTCTPPLSSLFRLWDFMFAYGTHLNILFIVAQLKINRSVILRSPQPMRILRNFPNLDEENIIKLSLLIIKKLPKEVYDLIVRHGFDPEVPYELKSFLASQRR